MASPAAFSVGVLVVVGLNGFGGWRYQRPISLVLALGLLAYAIWLPMALVLPKYATTPTASDEQLAGAIPVDARLADGVQLVAYGLGRERALPGLPPAVWSPGESHVTQTSLWIPPEQLPDRLFVAVEPSLSSAGGASADQAGDGRILSDEVITSCATSIRWLSRKRQQPVITHCAPVCTPGQHWNVYPSCLTEKRSATVLLWAKFRSGDSYFSNVGFRTQMRV
jgi:hypothetical protein